MGIIETSVKEFVQYDDIAKALRDVKNVSISGVIDPCKEHVASVLSSPYKKCIYITYDEARARNIASQLKLYRSDVAFYPAKDFIFYNADIHGNQIVKERIDAIKYMQNNNAVLVTTIDALCDNLMRPLDFMSNIIKITSDSTVDIDALSAKLVNIGYEREAEVKQPGQFAVRGSIVDIFPITDVVPVRIDLWGDEIDSMKTFDAESQRSIETIDSIEIYPAKELIFSDDDIYNGIEKIKKETAKTYETYMSEKNVEAAFRLEKTMKENILRIEANDVTMAYETYVRFFLKKRAGILDYLMDDGIVILDEPARIEERLTAIYAEFEQSMTHKLMAGYILPSQMKSIYDYNDVSKFLRCRQCIILETLGAKYDIISAEEKFTITSKSINSYNNSFDMLIKDIATYKKKGYRIIIFSGSSIRAKRLSEDIWDSGISAYYSEDMNRDMQDGEVLVTYGSLYHGFEYPLNKIVFIAESDIFGKEKKKKVHKNYKGRSISDFNELSIGDYVVHENYGIGIYQGIEKIVMDRYEKDYIKIEYAKKGKLYILATNLDVIQKYASAGDAKPKLNAIGDAAWNKTKEKVKSAVEKTAKELVELYAKRSQMSGYKFSPDTPWQREFEDAFPFDETKDQLDAIAATKEDMESDKIMDRLICGDVGFGKTEVALRAAFKAVNDGKQVVYLVPTTILASQHYNTFVERMKNFAVNVRLLSRFSTTKQTKETLEGLEKGLVDIVIGTHKVLSPNVKYKDLGLLIIDEEQRFGVTHKEKIKQLKNDIDVLSLSATPIPRTLHMSLAGIRDMSVLEEPPVDRMPIQTFVTEYDEIMVKAAINRELSRNGQVYYVYNRVNTIEDVTRKLRELVPEANISYAHGRMDERVLEKIMFDFINGEIDVLVSTTIIETGLDIPNVNTIIIHDADRFGLSQLYQLRGRVGRANRSSYAFLMYKRDLLLRETAEKRLSAIKEFTDLGSGFKIAMKDLEIRGAGNVLGEAQHGHMAAVGYDLYCKMLNEAVEDLKGIQSVHGFETAIDIAVDAFVPSTYIKSEAMKLDIYKRIASIANETEYYDMVDELTDRFGDIPKAANILLKVSLLKSEAHNAYVTEIKGNQKEITIKMFPKAPIDTSKIGELITSYKRKLKIIPDKEPYFTYTFGKDEIKGQDGYIEIIRGIIRDIFKLCE